MLDLFHFTVKFEIMLFHQFTVNTHCHIMYHPHTVALLKLTQFALSQIIAEQFQANDICHAAEVFQSRL